MTRGIFITGTDTGVGKTTVAIALMRVLQDSGLRVAGMKPVASGCAQTPEGLRNEDAEKLIVQSSVSLPYEFVNPFAFEPPIAPHIAANAIGVNIDIDVIRSCYGEITRQVDVVVVEGAGGWLVPINERQTMADVAVALGLPVINVVAIRLGCLNHALLTHDAIGNSGATQMGWIANLLEREALMIQENIDTVRRRTGADLIGEMTIDSSVTSPLLAGLNVDLLLSRLGLNAKEQG